MGHNEAELLIESRPPQNVQNSDFAPLTLLSKTKSLRIHNYIIIHVLPVATNIQIERVNLEHQLAIVHLNILPSSSSSFVSYWWRWQEVSVCVCVYMYVCMYVCRWTEQESVWVSRAGNNSQTSDIFWPFVWSKDYKTENCVVVLLCGFNRWHTHYWCYVYFCVYFSIYVYFCVQKMQVCEVFYCAVNHCPHVYI